MMSAHAEVATSTPDRFIRQFVSHLGRKAASGLQPDGTGLITIQDGQCTLAAGEELLVLATADSDQGLARVQDVVGRHLERFGARAALRVQWTAGPRDAGPMPQGERCRYCRPADGAMPAASPTLPPLTTGRVCTTITAHRPQTTAAHPPTVP